MSASAAHWLRRFTVGVPLPHVEVQWSWERQARLEQVSAGARASVAALLALAMLSGRVDAGRPAWIVWAALVAFVFADALFRRRHADQPPRYRWGSALGDLLFNLALVLTTGGPFSPLIWLLPFGLVWQAHRLEPHSSLPVTAAYSVAVLLLHPAALFDAALMLVLGAFLALAAARRTDLHRQNLRDGLTGCFSRGFVLLTLRHLIRDGAYPFSVLFLDLDYFKRVNDTLGHEVGDRALVHAARAITLAVRGDDVVARYGGDEFLVVMPGASIGEAGEVAERVRTCLCQSLPATFGPLDGCNVTVSCGAAEAHPGQGINEILAAADGHLYEAKQRRDCVITGPIGA